MLIYIKYKDKFEQIDCLLITLIFSPSANALKIDWFSMKKRNDSHLVFRRKCSLY